MLHFLAAEGGYQQFELGGAEWFWLIFSAATALLALATGFYLMRGVLAADEGTPTMIEIAKAIQEGALAYLRRQFRTILVILVPVAIIVFLTSTKVVNHGDALHPATESLSRVNSGNVRTAAAAKTGSLRGALHVAFRTGGIAGMFTVGLGLLGATTIIMIFQNTSSAILVGFGFGGSLLALFLRVGGGIFTKAA